MQPASRIFEAADLEAAVKAGFGYSAVADVLYFLADSMNALGSNNVTGGDLLHTSRRMEFPAA